MNLEKDSQRLLTNLQLLLPRELLYFCLSFHCCVSYLLRDADIETWYPNLILDISQRQLIVSLLETSRQI